MRHFLLGLLAFVALVGCGDDGSAGTGDPTSTGPGTGGAGGGAGGSGGGGAAGGGGGSGGQGGSWENVDPLEGSEPVALIQGGFEFTEGPCWFAAQDVLRFSDIPPSEIHEVTAQDEVSLWRMNSGGANGLGITPDGLQITCEGVNRQVTRSASSDMIEVVADNYLGDPLNAPNDNVVRSDGTIYFTDPDYGIAPPDKVLTFQGVFRIATDGEVTLVSDALSKPNGVALSPDEATLYVTDADTDELHVFPVNADGTTGPGQKLVDTSNTPDGMAVDDAGNLYLSTEAGIDVHRADGTLRGNIPVPEQPANCAFGGADRRTLYITARTSLYKVRLNVPGKP